MTQVDPNTRKRHWFLAVWSVPQAGFLAPISAYVSSDKRRLTIPEINAAKAQRQLGDGAVLINLAYVGLMTQYELTGTSPVPVPTTTSAAFNLGLEQALSVPNPEQLVNAFDEADTFSRAEWELGFAQGCEVRKKIVAASARPPETEMHPVLDDPV